jgi:hypothetical protein
MSKRSADANGGAPLKDRERPDQMDVDMDNKDMGDFEDEFEDEFESEDEIIEAGVDGRPDAEREAEEKAGSSAPFDALRVKSSNGFPHLQTRPRAVIMHSSNTSQRQWRLTKAPSSSAAASSSPARRWPPI